MSQTVSQRGAGSGKLGLAGGAAVWYLAMPCARVWDEARGRVHIYGAGAFGPRCSRCWGLGDLDLGPVTVSSVR